MSAEVPPTTGRGWRRTARPRAGRLSRVRGRAVIAGAGLLLLFVIGLAAPGIVSVLGLAGPTVRDPAALNLFSDPTGPSSAHPLGVDAFGRDLLARCLFGLRSLLLVSVAGAAIATAVVAAAAISADRLGRRGGTDARGAARVLGARAMAALSCLPPLLLALAAFDSLGSGPWRPILAIAITQTPRAWLAARGRRAGTAVLAAGARALCGGIGLAVALPLLGLSPGGRGPQIGAMIAQAGRGTLAGIPEAWALLSPGAIALLALLAARAVHGGLAADGGVAEPLAGVARIGSSALLGPAGTILGLLLALALGWALLPDLGTRGGGGTSLALGRLGGAIGASLSLLAGASAVWLLGVAAIVAIPGRRRLRGIAGRVGAILAGLLAAAPVPWLGFVVLAIFSDSVGTVPLLPGAGRYVGPGTDPGSWAGSLLLPWLVLGLTAVAASAPRLRRAVRRTESSAQQRVARAAGVPGRTLARQRRSIVALDVLALAGTGVGQLIGAALLTEVVFAIPGTGRLAVHDLHHGAPAIASDLTMLAFAAALGLWLGVEALGRRIDPGGWWR